MIYPERGTLLGCAFQYTSLQGSEPINGPLPHPFQGIRCGSLKIDTLTLDTLRLV